MFHIIRRAEGYKETSQFVSLNFIRTSIRADLSIELVCRALVHSSCFSRNNRRSRESHHAANILMTLFFELLLTIILYNIISTFIIKSAYPLLVYWYLFFSSILPHLNLIIISIPIPSLSYSISFLSIFIVCFLYLVCAGYAFLRSYCYLCLWLPLHISSLIFLLSALFFSPPISHDFFHLYCRKLS